MYRIITILILLFLIIIGFFKTKSEIKGWREKLDKLIDFQNHFIDFANELIGKQSFRTADYDYCIGRSNSIQSILGSDGIVAYADQLRGISSQHYPIVLNVLPELKDFYYMGMFNELTIHREQQVIGTCDDAIKRRCGSINDLLIVLNKQSTNPVRCLCKGVKTILEIPFLILSWCGIITDSSFEKVSGSRLLNFLSGIITFVGFAGSIISIVIGWEQFKAIINNIVR